MEIIIHIILFDNDVQIHGNLKKSSIEIIVQNCITLYLLNILSIHRELLGKQFVNMSKGVI